ncbi:TPA: hypothetical protein ACSQQD_005751 [Pseudomonas aeruginosa]|uniref:hypothetical protein n=1 Tax=Pseudomonas aeruginosa TaxID=287 RepID=UPI001AEC65B8|nr:hypothetical protein [Pseudomonas aeruginosa]MBP2696575.1 hypothetical protein [Pseudomonas aeruginosa]HEP8409189.1 hypothetical protein [Pseudomonas aeruginosa]
MSNDQQIRELTKVVNSHASDIQTLTAAVFGLIAHLNETHGNAGVDSAKGKALSIAKSMGSTFGARPNTQQLSILFDSAKVPN